MKTTSQDPTAPNSKTALKAVSIFGLALTVVPAFLVFAGLLSWSTHALLMAVGTVLWFATAPFCYT